MRHSTNPYQHHQHREQYVGNLPEYDLASSGRYDGGPPVPPFPGKESNWNTGTSPTMSPPNSRLHAANFQPTANIISE